MTYSESHRREDDREWERAETCELSRQERVRLRYVLHASQYGVASAADHFGYDRSTISKWLKRYLPGHPETLKEKSRAPHKKNTSQTDPAVVEEIRRLRLADRHINRKGIRAALLQNFHEDLVPCDSTIGRILQREELTIRDLLAPTPTAEQLQDAPVPKRDSDDTAGTSGVAIGSLAAALFIGVALSLGLGAGEAHAADSASYTLRDQFPNDATSITKESSNYQLTEDSLTWHKKPLTGTNYILNGALSNTDVVSGTTGGGTTGGTTGGGTTGGGGNCNGSACNQGGGDEEHGAAPSSHSSSSQSYISARPSAPAGEATSQATISPVTPENLHDVVVLAQQSNADFFTAVDNLCAPCTQQLCPAAVHSSAPVLPMHTQLPIAVAVIAGIASLFMSGTLRLIKAVMRRKPFLILAKKSKAKAKPHHSGLKSAALRYFARNTAASMEAIIIAAAVMVGVFWAQSAFAASTGPQTHVYNGRLLDSSGNAVTSATSVRFSYWLSEDSQSGDVTGTGAINVGASNYGDWNEVHTVTPNSSGYFSLKMGSVTALPSLASYSVGDLTDLFLQVEVKASTSADTSYELLDTDASSATIDRSPILSVPFALNADRIDQRDVGTGSGSIPVLGSGGLLPVAAAPSATNADTLMLDKNNTATAEIALQFGQTLAKKLSYDILNSRFNFNDSVNIEGDLTVTGLINGVDITDLSGSDTYLKASSGAGLNLQVGAGSYRVNGDITTFAGSGAVALRANATQKVYFTGTGLTVTTGGLPDDKSFIPVAQVTTSTGAITAVTDLRVLSSDNREQTVEKNFHPGYENTSYQADASNNVGQLYVTHDAISGNNFYMWTSTKTATQDYDLYVRVTLSPDFTGWSGVPLQIGYRSTSALNTDNALAIQVYDTNGQPVTLGGSSSGLASATWTTTDLTFGAGSTWTPGSEFLIKFTMQAKDSYQIHLGKMRLRYIDLLDE